VGFELPNTGLGEIMTSRCWSFVAALLLAVGLVVATPTLVLAAHGGGDSEKVPPGEAKTDIFEPRLDLTIWTIIVFVALLIVLKKFAWKPMLAGLQGRELRIRGALDEAHTARDEAQKMREQLQAEMAQIQDKMREMLDVARRDGQAVKDRLVAEGKAEIQAESDRSRREIQMETERAKQELWNQTAQLATLVSAKVIGRSLSPDDHRGLVDEAVAELRGAPTKTTA
jgi:F-type H+-transporting ATPase subunit b